MEEDELKYVMRLLDDLSDAILEEILKFHDEVERRIPHSEFSKETWDFFKINLKNNPVTTSKILMYIQEQSQNETVINNIQIIYLEILKVELSENNCSDKLITLISLIKWKENFVDKFIHQILIHLTEDGFRQYRKQILLSLLPHDKPYLLSVASEAMQRNEPQKEFKLTPEYMLELCYQDKIHWLLKAAEVYKHQLLDMESVTFKINNFTKQILIMVLIDLTNSAETYDLSSLVHQLTNIFSILDTYTTSDDQLQFYLTEIKRELTVIKFCLENNCKIMTTCIFSQVLSQSALTVISQVCRLSKIDRYKVSRLLNINNDFMNELVTLSSKKEVKKRESNSINWDVLTYNSYCAITKVIDTILNSSEGADDPQETSSSLEDVKRLILSLQPLQYCVEVIENIFSCLFLRYEFFSCYEQTQEFPCGTHSECSYFYSKKQTKSPKYISTDNVGFICNAFTMQIVLNTLKLCLEKIDDDLVVEDIDPDMVARFKNLIKIVNHSMWKLQLVSTLSPETNPLQLKLCLDYVEVDGSSEEEEHEYDVKALRKKTKNRRKHNSKQDVDHAMLTSTISANEDAYLGMKGNSIDFISTMLSQPNCLVALALFNNDFSKANQILEMFDLADSEIATEVTFTEQLRHLVAKIKNIIYYRDDTRYATKELSSLSVVSTEVMGLVEGFLATNRAPNSFDILELATRHPHLQLYSHQNAPFINAVDILLSSGLNREITYGLINVVERKLAEVRNCTDVTAVKKNNYIRFVEDVASVTFEIFGNTDKSFDFVDNICGLIVDCRIPLKHKEFCKMNQLAKELRQSCDDLVDVVNITESVNIDQNLLQKYHQTYMNVVAASDKDICNVGEVSCHGNKKSRIPYLRMCYMYCKTVSQLEQEENQSSDTSVDLPYFFVLGKQLHDVFGNMINKNEIPVTNLEPICKKLNVNLIPKLILNFCPSITLASSHKEATEENFNNLLQYVYEFRNPEENLFLDPVANFAPLPRSPDPQCLTYIILHNWVLAHIIKKIHTTSNENSLQQSMDARTKALNNYMELERFNCLKVLFDGNKYLASLHTSIDLDKLFVYMPKLIGAGKILKCLNIIESLSETQQMCSANLSNLRDLILFKLATNSMISNNWRYCQYLKCPELKLNLILNNLNSWSAEGAMEILDYLRFLLNQEVLEEGFYEKCTDWMIKIPLYSQIASIMGANHWYDVYEKSMENPENIIELLLDSQQYKLCLEWADVHNVSENVKNLIVKSLLQQLFEYTNQATPEFIQELLRRLPMNQAMDLIQEEMSKVRNVEILQVCIEFISENSFDWKLFENIKIGLQIMVEIDTNLRHLFWDLIEKPLLMIEQFLMNAKLDVLANIINKIWPNLKKDPSGDNLYYNIKIIESVIISKNAVDALLRFYAEKALDMKNPLNACPVPPKFMDDSLLQSIDSINIESANKPFIMPEQVPTKEQWAEDYSTDRCMLCRTSIFSMIIRRHHCRRCGRLVCHACSSRRMQVPTYPSGVKFRVCNDCYTQTMTKKSSSEYDNVLLSSNSDSAASGTTCMDWCLSANSGRNEAVRAEFNYEFTPNVTLCLSIMKMHSINLDYPRFLLDRSDEVARELSRGGDARLLVRARRSLLLAAAELYSRTPQEKNGAGNISRLAETGAAHATRCLAHADAMATLVKHQAHHLIPQQGAHPSQIVRSLLEAEKWELALEIATKSGLPRNSVLAAWGKACLKAGCFKQAREKFAHCFKSTVNVYVEDDCEFGKEASESHFMNRRVQSLRYSERSSSSVSSVQSDGRPRTNPPLLNEIVNMLENMNYPVNQQLLNKAETIKTTNEKLTSLNMGKKKIQLTEPALNIMHTLASVKKIKQGDYSDFQTAFLQPKKSLAQGLLRRNNNHSEPKTDQNYKRLDPFFYKECVYYLTNYGSHVANIAFYLKHSNMTEVITYCYDNFVEKETFTECVYMECLKKDRVNELLKAMSDMDSTLEMWSEYIMHICRTLEMSKRLEALYALQCGSGQHARASATCALLYSRPTARGPTPFAALHARQHHLNAALHHLGQCVPVAVKTNDPKSLNFNLDKATIDNLMTTITRQMELTKYLAACEASGRLTEKVLNEVIPVQSGRRDDNNFRPVTLFGSTTDKIRLVAVVLATGQSIEAGFELAFKIITEHKLDSMNIYTHVARYLVQSDRFMEVKTLAKCIRSSKEIAANLMSDQVLQAGVTAVVTQCEARGQLHDEQAEILIADIHSVTIKISCYLTCRNVSSAYILAARNDRTNDLRRVLQESERLGNDHVRNACIKRLTSKNVL